ncbi:hypothetical protein [Streptomyces humicola]|uniref:hypothetical protein n=1 Tax=Streptomyces humicola TaxID=2953240 RepID=UPI00210A9C04|nr:hypothetical protein [Streptomyces humicola]
MGATAAELVAPGEGPRLVEAYNRHEPQVQRETLSTPYSDVLAEALRRAADEKIEPHDDDAQVLHRLLAGLPRSTPSPAPLPCMNVHDGAPRPVRARDW